MAHRLLSGHTMFDAELSEMVVARADTGDDEPFVLTVLSRHGDTLTVETRDGVRSTNGSVLHLDGRGQYEIVASLRRTTCSGRVYLRLDALAVPI